MGTLVNSLQHTISLYILAGLHRSVSTQEFIQFLCMRSEEAAAMMCDISMRKGRRIETQTIVADLGNLSLKKHYYWPAIETMRAVRL